MKYVILAVTVLVFCSLHGALGIICKVCTPDPSRLRWCLEFLPYEFREVNCDNESFPSNVSEGTKYDACAKTTIVLEYSDGHKIEFYDYSCAVKANSTNPSVVNCSIAENYVCGDAKRKAVESRYYSIDSCSSECCLEESCNSPPTPALPPTINVWSPASSNVASTTDANTTATCHCHCTCATSNVSVVQPSCLGLLLIQLSLFVVNVYMQDFA